MEKVFKFLTLFVIFSFAQVKMITANVSSTFKIIETESLYYPKDCFSISDSDGNDSIIIIPDTSETDTCWADRDSSFIKIYDPNYLVNGGNYIYWSGKYLIAAGVILRVPTGKILDITNADIVFDINAGIDFEIQSVIRANNSVFRPCKMEGTWRGLVFFSESKGFINECTFKNAEMALNFLYNNDTGRYVNITNNLFSNNHYAIYSSFNNFSEAISGNTFLLNKNPFKSYYYFGIYADNSGFTLISQNDFINNLKNNDTTSLFYYGIDLFNCTKGTVSDNKFTDLYRSINFTVSNNMTIENNKIFVTINYLSENQIRAKDCENIIISGNELKNYNKYDSLSLNNAAIYLEGDFIIKVNNNYIEGFRTAIQCVSIDYSSLVENRIVNSYVYGIYMFDGYRNDVSCNEIKMKLLTDAINSYPVASFPVGIGYYNNIDLDSILTIRNNCILETSIAIYLQNNGQSNNNLPLIFNNFLYSYTSFGVLNIGFGGYIGTYNLPGSNTFFSNNYRSGLGAYDIYSFSTTITAYGNWGIMKWNPNVIILDSTEYYSTASCGHQDELPFYNQNFFPEKICDRQEIYISPLLITSDQDNYSLNTKYIENLTSVPDTKVAEIVINMLKLFHGEMNLLQFDKLYNDISTSGILTGNNKLYFDFQYHFLMRNYTQSLMAINQVSPENQDEIDLVEICRLLANCGIMKKTNLSVNEISVLKKIENANRACSSIARDILHAYQKNCDFIYVTMYSPLSVPTDKSIIREERLFSIFPNPTRDKIHVRYYLKDIKDATLNICNLNGQLLSVYPLTFNGGDLTVDLSNLIPGAYFVSIIDNEEFVHYFKLIKY